MIRGMCGGDSRRPYGTAAGCGGWLPRVSPGAIFMFSLRENGKATLIPSRASEIGAIIMFSLRENCRVCDSSHHKLRESLSIQRRASV